MNGAISRVQGRHDGQWHDPVPDAVAYFPNQVANAQQQQQPQQQQPQQQQPQRQPQPQQRASSPPRADVLMDNLALRSPPKKKLTRTERYAQGGSKQ